MVTGRCVRFHVFIFLTYSGFFGFAGCLTRVAGRVCVDVY